MYIALYHITILLSYWMKDFMSNVIMNVSKHFVSYLLHNLLFDVLPQMRESVCDMRHCQSFITRNTIIFNKLETHFYEALKLQS